MKNTRFMEVLFSAVENKDEELANQVAKDIEDAKANGVVDTDEVKYESDGSGKVVITDKETGEVTVAEKANDEEGTYDLYPAMPDSQIEGFLHPELDGVTPGQQVGAPDEDYRTHMDGSAVISPNLPDGGLNPAAGQEASVEALAQCGPEACTEEEKEFSVSTDNSVVLRIFSDQEFCERLFSEVIESEETVKVGDLKVEKLPEGDAVLVTSNSTGDQAKVTMDGDEMEVTELESKNFSEAEQNMPLYVVGVDPINHVIVDAQEYCPESAQELVQRLSEQGVEAVQVFESPEEAREYAISLLESLGVQNEEAIEEPQQVEFSDHSVYLTKFYSDNNGFMCKLFSETVNDIDASQAAIEDAIESGDQVETATEIITPISEKEAVIEDKSNGEFTKVTLDDENMNLQSISKEEAEELTSHIEFEDDEDEKTFSDIYCDEAETKFFSEHEEMTEYMIRLFSDTSDSSEIEKAIETGEVIENEKEVITPISATEAVVEDKANGEFTKVVMDDEKLDVHPLTKEEAEELSKDDETEKTFSELEDGDIYCDEAETKFFSEHEEMTEYMVRLFSDCSDCSKIEEAIESGKEVETEKEIIKPISATEAVVEDKENGEFTKVVMDDEKFNIKPLTEEEADKLEKKFSNVEEKVEEPKEDNPVLSKYFSETMGISMASPVPAGAVDPNMPVIPVDPAAVAVSTPVDQVAAEAPVAPVEGAAAATPESAQPQTTVEAIEDKALAAVQSIQEMAQQASDAIMQAKEAPVQPKEADLREAQFSANSNENKEPGTLVSWLNDNLK